MKLDGVRASPRTWFLVIRYAVITAVQGRYRVTFRVGARLLPFVVKALILVVRASALVAY